MNKQIHKFIGKSHNSMSLKICMGRGISQKLIWGEDFFSRKLIMGGGGGELFNTREYILNISYIEISR